MALVSPGISISINDQSQYVNSNVGSVPLVVLATAQDKTYNGAPATGTSKANAGKLLAFSSQRDLVTQMGTPKFQIGSAGTPVNGSEINEYGLMAAYSALGLSNQLFAIRADVDLAQLTGTSVRPIGAPSDGTTWLDTANTVWGIEVLDAVTGTFGAITPLLITNSAQVTPDNNFAYPVPTPISSIGQVGQYALVFVNTDGSSVSSIRLFYKADTNSVGLNNTWVQVGSTNWQKAHPVVTGTVSNPTIAINSTLTINTVTVTSDGTVTTLGGTNGLVAKINAAAIPGVSAALTTTGKLMLFATSAAKSNGSTVDGKIILVDGTNTPLATTGVTGTSFYSPYLFYGNFAQAPAGGWFSTDTQPRPTGSIWWKTTATGNGFNPVFKHYSASTGTFNTESTSMYSGIGTAIYSIDPTNGGLNIPAHRAVALFNAVDTTSNSLRFSYNTATTVAAAYSAVSGPVGTFTVGNSFYLYVTHPGSSANVSYIVTLSDTKPESFVSDILALNIADLQVSYDATSNTFTLTHLTDGAITLTKRNGFGDPITDAGFVSGQGSGFAVNSILNQVYINDFLNITNSTVYSATQPYSAPATGTYWYYSNPADVDIMINDGTAWKGYQNVSADVRGYDLSATDAGGVIISATKPTSQTDGTSWLVAGDLWLDSSDLVNYPSLYRYNGTSFVAIDTTDHVSQNGIIFADARWDATGTTDIISGAFPTTKSLLISDYLDLDAPDYRLYPRGTLLFNTRRSGYNVKKFVSDYFNATSFPNDSLPTIKDTWVTASGLDSMGRMKAGSMAQRAIVVAAMQSAIDSNLDALSPNYQFNLIVAPGYPELIPNMITLNDNRGDTAFIIGDTPLDMAPNTIDITNWVNNTNGNGLAADASANAYLALYYPAGLTNDLAGNQVVVPASHAVLRTFLYSDQVSYPWFAPAGVNRGHVSNLSSIGYINSTTGQFVTNGVSQGLRDALFTLAINPITQLPGTGLVVWGQLTRSGSSTARDRVNVVRLENYLRTIFNSVANGYLFEPNDGVTRKSIASQIESALNNVLAHRGLYDFLVICDTSNNTPATISNNQLYVDVAIEPMRDVEFIYIPIAIYNPGSIAALNTTST